MMEYTKDEVFTISYPVKKDKLQEAVKKRIRDTIKQNKILVLFFVMGITFMVFDLTFIYYFFSLLTKL